VKAIEVGLLTLGSSYWPTPSRWMLPPVARPVGVRPRSQWRVREGLAPSSRMLHLYSHSRLIFRKYITLEPRHVKAILRPSLTGDMPHSKSWDLR
jgi:hypothetical protein